MDFIADDIIKLLLALVIGGCVGAEREYHSKAAGLRTTILICVGSALFTIISERFGSSGDRIAANIVNGIGFLGAGIIYREESRVRGLTTAATVWVVAALGMGIGTGNYGLSVLGFGVVMGSLLLLRGASNRLASSNQTRNYKIVTTYRNKTLHESEKVFEEYGLRPRRGPQRRTGTEITGYWHVGGSVKNHERCIKRLLNDPDVKEFVF